MEGGREVYQYFGHRKLILIAISKPPTQKQQCQKAKPMN